MLPLLKGRITQKGELRIKEDYPQAWKAWNQTDFAQLDSEIVGD